MTSDDVLALLESGAGRFSEDEPVDERMHALQCAHLAASAGADDELVVAAALHDIGYHPDVKARFPDMPHERSGAAFAADLCSRRVAWLVAQHVPAKRYLVATDPEYAATLSDASVRSLARQGGPMSAAEIAEFEAQPWSADAARLRRWDDLAKVPGAPTLAADDLRPILSRVIARSV